MRRRLPSGPLLLLLTLSIGGCAVADLHTLGEVEDRMTGLSADDLRLCAGLPERTAKGTDGREYWSYERHLDASSGTVSFAGFGLNIAGGRECRATFEVSDGKVTRSAFTRATSASACAPLVQTCVRLARSGRLTPAPPTELAPTP